MRFEISVASKETTGCRCSRRISLCFIGDKEYSQFLPWSGRDDRSQNESEGEQRQRQYLRGLAEFSGVSQPSEAEDSKPGLAESGQKAEAASDLVKVTKLGVQVAVQDVSASTAEVADALSKASNIVTVGLLATSPPHAVVSIAIGQSAEAVSLSAKIVHVVAGGEKYGMWDIALGGMSLGSSTGLGAAEFSKEAVHQIEAALYVVGASMRASLP